MDKENYLRINEVAKIAGITRQQIYNYLKLGLISPTRIGRGYYYSAKDIKKIIKIQELLKSRKYTLLGIKEIINGRSK